MKNKKIVALALSASLVMSVGAMAAPTSAASDGSRNHAEQSMSRAARLIQEAKVVDLDWGKYVALRFAQGNTMANCTLTVDGVDVTSAVTNVTDDGSVVKWEITDLDHAELVVSNGTDSQTIVLGRGEGTAPVLAADTDPDYFLLNGPIYVWDYHLTNYDASGAIRVSPEKTTFNTSGKEENSIPYYSPDAILYQDENALPYQVRGEVQLMFNYAAGTEAEQAFVDGITDVDLVGFNDYKNTLNDALSYDLVKDFEHGSHTVACIKVPLGQSNFYSNGRYNLRVTSHGTAKLFPIHVVNEVVPSMEVTGDTGYSGKEVHLRISDMTYGITRPVYRVDLKDTKGQTHTLAKFDDWFLHGDLLVLYNENTNYFPVSGQYTVTVYADGFQPFSKTFYQKAFSSARAAAEAPAVSTVSTMSVDAISTASVGGGSDGGGSSDGGGDTKVMNANLIVDADLMANAKILGALNIDNAAAEGIAQRWDTMNQLYVFNEGAEQVYDFDRYTQAVSAAEVQGEYLTFAEYTASPSAVTTLNRPYAVKQVLEDNLLGETTNFRQAVSPAAPALELIQQSETQAVFSCADQVYLTKMAAEGELVLNAQYGGMPLKQSDYSVNAAAGTLTLNTVQVGKNSLKVSVPGYKTAEVIFAIDKVLEAVQLTAPADLTRGEALTITCGDKDHTCDFFQNLTGVKLIAPNGAQREVRPEGQEMIGGEIGYTVENNALTIGKNIFNEKFAVDASGAFQTGAYQVVLTAAYYDKQTLTVNVTDSSETEQQPAPVVADITEGGSIMGKYQRVSFNGDVADYLSAVTEVTLNGKAVKKVTNLFGETGAYKFSKDSAYGGANKFMDFTMDCFNGEVKAVVKATGYEDLIFTVVDGKLVPNDPAGPSEPAVPAAPEVSKIAKKNAFFGGNYYIVSFAGEEDAAASFVEAINNVTVDGQKVSRVSSFFNDTMSYKTANDPAYGGAYRFLHFTEDCFQGSKTVVISADGYEDLTFQVRNGVLVEA